MLRSMIQAHFPHRMGTMSPLRNVKLSMARVLEINQIDKLASSAASGRNCCARPPARRSSSRSNGWRVYWRHFGAGQQLRVLVVSGRQSPTGILPLVVRSETDPSRPAPRAHLSAARLGLVLRTDRSRSAATLAAGLEHIRRTRRDWDILELRWQGAVGTDPTQARGPCWPPAFKPIQPYGTAPRSSISPARGNRTGRRARGLAAAIPPCRTSRLPSRAKSRYVRYRPLGRPHDDGSPRWDLYDACEELARRSWQGAATNGTTLSHETVRGFLRDVHEAAAAAGAVDLNLLLIDGAPVAFVYGYHYRGYVYGLRRGYDAGQAAPGAGNVLLAHAPRQLRPRRPHLRHGRRLAGKQAALSDAAAADPALQPFSAAGAAHAVAAR